MKSDVMRMPSFPSTVSLPVNVNRGVIYPPETSKVHNGLLDLAGVQEKIIARAPTYQVLDLLSVRWCHLKTLPCMLVK